MGQSLNEGINALFKVLLMFKVVVYCIKEMDIGDRSG